MATDRNRLRGVVVAAAKGLNGREEKKCNYRSYWIQQKDIKRVWYE